MIPSRSVWRFRAHRSIGLIVPGVLLVLATSGPSIAAQVIVNGRLRAMPAKAVQANGLVADLQIGDARPAAGPGEAAQVAATRPGQLDAYCNDGSVVKVLLRDEKIPIKTDYGLLEVPVKDIRRIDFATRLPQGVLDQVAAAIKNLASSEFKVREEASAELLTLGRHAYPALLAAAESEDAEVVLRADKLLEQIRKAVPEDDLAVYDFDLIHTSKSQIGGTIEIPSLKVATEPFGEQTLPIAQLRSLNSGEEKESEPANVLPDPGNMNNYQGQIGKTFYFRLTGPPQGRGQGGVWGSDIYTFDSTLSTAAVHAGVLKAGETKVVGVTMLGPQDSFASSSRNGVVTGNWGQYPSAYKFVTKKASGRPLRAAR